MLGTQILLGSDSALATLKGRGLGRCLPSANSFTYVISFTSHNNTGDGGYPSPCTKKEEPKALELKPVAQGSMGHPAEADGSPGSPASKSQAARRVSLSPHPALCQGWGGRRRVCLCLEYFLFSQ